MFTINDLEVVKRYTHNIEMYQIEVLWKYKCKRSPRIHQALGFSKKRLYLNDEQFKIMIEQADSMARAKFICSPSELWRDGIKIIKYEIVEPSNIIKLKPTQGFKEFRKTHKTVISKEDYAILKKYHKNVIEENKSFKDFKESLTDKQKAHYIHSSIKFNKVFKYWKNKKRKE
jgi:hypothetical protein